MLAGAPTVPVALKVTDNAVDVTVAVRLFGPAVVPSVQLTRVAMPLAFVDTTPFAGGMVPPPLATANVALTPGSGLLCASRTSTDGAVATADPAVAFCASPA